MSSHPNTDDNANAPLPNLSDAQFQEGSFQDQQLELGEAEGLTTLRRAWERTLRALAATLNKQTIDNWLRPLRPLSYSQLEGGSVAVLGAPSSFAREFAEKKYAQTLTQLLGQHLDAPDIQVRFVIATPDVQPLLGEQPLPLQQAAALASTAMVGESGGSAQSAQLALSAASTDAVFDGSSSSGGAKGSRNPFALELSASPLVPRYTFDNFVVGKSNRLAQAGAVAVAQSPGATYNPLFLYGSPGLGKCVAASEFLHLADGRRVRAGELIGTEFTLLTVAKEEVRAVPARAEFNAIEPVLAITTESGRRIIRNGQHPLWAANGVKRWGKNYESIQVRGWTPLQAITAGDLVAVPESLPAFGSPVPLPEDEIKRLAAASGGDQRIPDAIFQLPREQLCLFLSHLFSADGWASCVLERPEIGFCSASEGLVRDIQELLLKLGIVSRLSAKANVNAWTVALHAASEVIKFADQVGIFGKEDAVARVRQVAERALASRPNRGEWRHRNAPLGMRWEKVVSVVPAGIEATVAVEVPDYHTFLSTFWEHNTHLMHAIGHQIRLALPQARVVYVSGEMFTNHYVTAIRDKRTEDFRRAYRNVDVWLVDDIQMLASKEQTKEEFFHTFNALHQMNKQIVLTSDRPPRELRAMDERLRSRFECGLVADISAPELEMRQAILQKKAILEDLAIPEEVIAFMANLIQSNIRALEGALIKLMAYASLIHSPVTKQLASDVLSGYYVERMTPRESAVRETASAHPEDHEFAFQSLEATARSVQGHAMPALPQSSAAGPAVDRIIGTIARLMGVTSEMIVAGGGRSNRATRLHGDANFARQVAMYLLKELGGVPLSMLAVTFGLKSHTAVVHAHGRLQKELDSDPQILGLIAKIRQEIERES